MVNLPCMKIMCFFIGHTMIFSFFFLLLSAGIRTIEEAKAEVVASVGGQNLFNSLGKSCVASVDLKEKDEFNLSSKSTEAKSLPLLLSPSFFYDSNIAPMVSASLTTVQLYSCTDNLNFIRGLKVYFRNYCNSKYSKLL